MKSVQSNRQRNKWLGISALLLVGGVSGYIFHANSHTGKAVAAPVMTQAAPSSVINMNLPDFSSIVRAQGPAVVNISVSSMAQAEAQSPFGDDDPFAELFKRFRQPGPSQKTPVHGLGSGFIVKSDGTILTNAHVVADADEVIVKLTDRREFKAKVLGVDKLSDVAVLKIAANNLPTVKLGSTENVEPGQWVVAIGAPYGLENTVTAGIVSAKSRTLPDEGYVPFLQTDVAINPGNSGGPLFNLSGEVIGINSQIYSQSGGSQGLSFAIPIDVAMKVEEQLLTKGKVTRGRLGVTIQPVTQELAQSFGLVKPEGALIRSVEKGSPADKAGIQSGDIILSFNGKKVIEAETLPSIVANTTPDSNATIEVWHQGKIQKLETKVAELKSEVAAPKVNDNSDSKYRLGLMLRPIDPREAKAAGTSEGLVVGGVTAGPAAKAGISVGDIILSVNGTKVKTVDALKAELEKRKGKVALQIKRDEDILFVPVNAG